MPNSEVYVMAIKEESDKCQGVNNCRTIAS